MNFYKNIIFIVFTIFLMNASSMFAELEEPEMTLETEVELEMEGKYTSALEHTQQLSSTKKSLLKVTGALGVGLAAWLGGKIADNAKDDLPIFMPEEETELECAGVNGTTVVWRNHEQRPSLVDLITAIKTEKTEQAHQLIARGVNLSFVDAEGETAAHWAYYMDNYRVLEYLICHGADLKQKNDAGESVVSLLRTACQTELETSKIYSYLLSLYTFGQQKGRKKQEIVVNPRQSVFISLGSTAELLKKILHPKKAKFYTATCIQYPFFALYTLGTSQNALRVLTPR